MWNNEHSHVAVSHYSLKVEWLHCEWGCALVTPYWDKVVDFLSNWSDCCMFTMGQIANSKCIEKNSLWGGAFSYQAPLLQIFLQTFP